MFCRSWHSVSRVYVLWIRVTEEQYTSMSDYIESTKNEFSYDIQEVIYEENWTGYHIKMISGEWLDSKKVDQVEWWHYVDIIIPKQTKPKSRYIL